MSTRTLSPTEVARLLQVNAHTVRRWCAAHADHLSPAANPARGGARTLTGRDLEVLRTVAQLRAQGLTGSQVNAQLAGLTFPDVEDVDAPASQDGPGAQESTALVPIALYAAERARWAAQEAELHARIEELQREIGRMEGARGKTPAWWRKLFGA